MSKGKLTPAIAESWETEDNGLTWTFHLRKGVKWVDQNGMRRVKLPHRISNFTGVGIKLHKNDAANTSMPMEMIVGAEDYYNMTNEMDADAALALTG